MFSFKTWAAALALATMAGAAPAALVLQSDGAQVLDTGTNLLWLRDWRVEGLQTWAESNDWASTLTVGGAAAGSWRLPTIDEFQDLWADADVGGTTSGLRAHFDNVQSTSLYWSGTSVSASIAVAFSPFTGGALDYFNKDIDLYAVAVRSATPGGGGTPVPEPQSATLALLGLGVAAAVSRRRQRDARG